MLLNVEFSLFDPLLVSAVWGFFGNEDVDRYMGFLFCGSFLAFLSPSVGSFYFPLDYSLCKGGCSSY
eukprot:g69121.t1